MVPAAPRDHRDRWDLPARPGLLDLPARPGPAAPVDPVVRLGRLVLRGHLVPPVPLALLARPVPLVPAARMAQTAATETELLTVAIARATPTAFTPPDG